MPGLNKIFLIGNLGGDVELRYLPSGKAVANWSMAVNEVFYRDEQKVEEVTWFYISAFGRAAEIAAEMLEKGSQVYIEGRLRTREYTDKEGVDRKSTDIIVRHLIILKGKPRERDPEDQSGRGHEDLKHDIPEDNIPF